MKVRTRFAPSPTGRLHLGNIRAAVFNWLFARRHGGSFVLRIEDTDVDRNVEGADAWVLEDLAWLGLEPDEGPDRGGPHGPYRDSELLDIHRETLERLLASGGAYPCFCGEGADMGGNGRRGGGGTPPQRYSGRCRALDPESALDRAASGEPHAVRARVPDALTEIQFEDEVFGTITMPSNDLDDFVICRPDGRVTYNFGVVSDDLHMRITHVIRGVGHLSNTHKQAFLYDALEAERPVFAHLPTVLAPEGGKLSKRTGATPVAELRAQGFPPDALVNYLSLLGWSHPADEEVLSRDELVRSISLERVGRADTRFDPEKMRWIAGQHLARMPLDELAEAAGPFVDAERFPSVAAHPARALGAVRSRITLLSDLERELAVLYPTEDETLAAVRTELGGDREVRRLVNELLRALATTEPWDGETLEAAVRRAGRDVGVGGARLFHPLRTALIGAEKGPELGRILAALGRTEAVERLQAVLGADG